MIRGLTLLRNAQQQMADLPALSNTVLQSVAVTTWNQARLLDADMSETLVVSSRGQITLPAAIRKRFGIKGGDIMLLESREGEIALKPGMVIAVQHYSDEQIAQWDADDKLDPQEKVRVLSTTSRLK